MVEDDRWTLLEEGPDNHIHHQNWPDVVAANAKKKEDWKKDITEHP
jgi:hypothetical protein